MVADFKIIIITIIFFLQGIKLITNRLGEPRRTFIPLVLKTASRYLKSDGGRRGRCSSLLQPCEVVFPLRPLAAELPGCL